MNDQANDSNIINQGFDRLIAAMSIPQTRKLWKVEDISEYFGVSTTTCYRCILCRPDFPEAIKISDGPKRWVSGEVMEWAEANRERRGRKAA